MQQALPPKNISQPLEHAVGSPDSTIISETPRILRQETSSPVSREAIAEETPSHENFSTGRNWTSFGKVTQVRNFKEILTLVQVLADSLTILASFLIGFSLWAWIGPNWFPQFYSAVPVSAYLFSIGVTLIVCLVGFEVNDLYHPQRSILNIREFEMILKTWAMCCGVTLFVLFLGREQFFSRGVFVLSWLTMLILLMFQRYGFFRFHNYLRVKGFVETKALIYGANEVGQKLLEKLKQSPKLGYHIMGFIDDSVRLRNQSFSDLPVLGEFQQLRDILNKSGAKKLFIAMPQVPRKVVVDILNICREANCEFQIVPSLYDIVIQRIKLSELDGIPLIGLREPKYSLRTRMIKRLFDLSVGSALLIATTPLFLILAIGVKASSNGPIIFRQKRVGFHGKKFLFYKFRSMYTEAPVYAVTPQKGNDPRITPFGRFLRRSSLDELPQLLNVIKGEMSLVGPRPEMPFIVSQYNDLQKQRLNVKPGITGLWQISADRKLAIHENMDYDIYYINNQSLLLDVVILIRTVTSCPRGIGAY